MGAFDAGKQHFGVEGISGSSPQRKGRPDLYSLWLMDPASQEMHNHQDVLRCADGDLSKLEDSYSPFKEPVPHMYTTPEARWQRGLWLARQRRAFNDPQAVHARQLAG